MQTRAGHAGRVPLIANRDEGVPALRCADAAVRHLAQHGVAHGSVGQAVKRGCHRHFGRIPGDGASAARGSSAGRISRRGLVLRHRDQKTTAQYAKVDRKTLRPLARPWPDGGAA
jgi:hypothetical protein